MISFHWKLSYMGEVEYEVHGDTPVKTVAVHRASAGTLNYDRYETPKAERQFSDLFIPKPMFWSPDKDIYEVEPWFSGRCQHCGVSIGQVVDPWGGKHGWTHCIDDGPDAYVYCGDDFGTEAEPYHGEVCCCYYCGSSQEHCEGPICCENTWPRHDPLTIALNGFPDVNTSRAYQEGN